MESRGKQVGSSVWGKSGFFLLQSSPAITWSIGRRKGDIEGEKAREEERGRRKGEGRERRAGKFALDVAAFQGQVPGPVSPPKSLQPWMSIL